MLQDEWLDEGKASCPIALLKTSKAADPAIGRIAPGHPSYPSYRAELDTVTAGDFARFPGGTDAG